MPPGEGPKQVTVAEEFQKNPDLTQEDLDELRQWLRTQKHLPEISDQLLILFHHSCYYVMADTKKCIEKYHILRSNTPNIFSNRDITKSPQSEHISSINFAVLPGLDNSGNRVFYYSLREYEVSKYHMYDHMKTGLMTFDLFSVQHGTAPGIVIVYDMMGTRFGHLTKINLLGWKRFLDYLQEGNPIRLKKIHMINVISFIDKIMALLRPLMSQKFYELMEFHTGNMDSFFEQVPRKYLPKEVGGSLDSIDVYNAETMQSLADSVDFFAEEEKLRIDESKRDKRKNNKPSKAEPNISFNRLEID